MNLVATVKTVNHGTATGAVAHLKTRDSSGSQVAATRTISFTPDGSGVSVDFSIGGLTVTPASIIINMNFYGPSASQSLWKLQLFNANSSTWEDFIDNTTAVPNHWTVITGTVGGTLTHYVASSTLKVRVLSASTTSVAYLDSIGCQVLSSANEFPPFGIGLNGIFSGSWNKNSSPENTFVAGHVIVDNQQAITSINNIKAINSNLKALFYQKVAGVKTDGSDGSLYTTALSQNLFAYDATGAIVTNPTNHWNYIDIITPATRTKWINAIVTYQTGNMAFQDGLRYDNVVTLQPTFSDQVSALPANYNQDAWYAALNDVMVRVEAAFPTKITMYNGYNGSADVGYRGLELLTSTISGMMWEGFAYKTNATFFSDIPAGSSLARWLQAMTDFASLNSTKTAIAFEYCNPVSNDQQRAFSVASYLCVTHPTSLWLIGAVSGGTPLGTFSEYKIDIGQPLAAMFNVSTGVYQRNYTNGYVVVNADANAHNYTITADTTKFTPGGTQGAFPDASTITWSAQVAGTVSMAAHTALIFQNP